MKKIIRILGFMPALITMCVLALGLGQAVNAQVTFAQFLQQSGGQDFVFTNNTTSGDFSTVSGGTPVNFFYSNISGLPAELQGLQSATVTVTSTTTDPATGSGQLVQPLNSVTTIAIIRDTPTSGGVGTGSRTNLLTATVTTASATPGISGGVGGNSATLNVSTPGNNVLFTSDFLSFGLTTQRAGGLSFSSVTPAYNQGAGGFLVSLTAAGTGTFSSDPPPIYGVPTAAPAMVAGKVTNMSGRGIRRAVVQMLDSSGNVRYARTNSFGRFRFNDVEVGQTYIFSVEAKGYSFAPQVINVGENIRDLEFTQSFFW